MKLVFGIILCLSFSSIVAAMDCDKIDRIVSYNSLLKSLNIMNKGLPALTPKEIEFYKDVKDKYPENPQKYKRIIASNEYLIFDNGEHVNHLINLTGETILSAELKDPYNEITFMTNLFMRAISDHSQYFRSYRDSDILFKRKLVNKSYVDEAKMISFKIAAIGLCVQGILNQIENV